MRLMRTASRSWRGTSRDSPTSAVTCSEASMRSASRPSRAAASTRSLSTSRPTSCARSRSATAARGSSRAASGGPSARSIRWRAILPDQRATATSLPSLWPRFPYRRLRRYYDVFLPMAYSTYRGRGASFVYGYTAANIAYLRFATGDPALPVHLIGGWRTGWARAKTRRWCEPPRTRTRWERRSTR